MNTINNIISKNFRRYLDIHSNVHLNLLPFLHLYLSTETINHFVNNVFSRIETRA